MSLVRKLEEKRLITPPKFLTSNTIYETIMGSQAYGCSGGKSDTDVYGIAIPPKEYLFPHLKGHIPGFGVKPPSFDEFEQHHIIDKQEEREYDVKILSIVKVFELARQGNPNIIDMLFTPQNCVLTQTAAGNIIRENRRLFLSKLCFPKFKGYSFAQIKLLKDYKAEGKRKATIEKFGWDVKAGYHLVRLLNEIEQILLYEDLDLQANNEELKAIRKGEISQAEVLNMFDRREKNLETIYAASKLRAQPDEGQLRTILLSCLDIQYEGLAGVVANPDKYEQACEQIKIILGGL